ncbi:hypothetical protein K7640_17280 [Micromonospora sp. PLK6-60]|uniref:hypothetical protein n=1 Tax=Micromonospora sp. PLK6-60 TaxID=2873383 RepID=UPI001CA75259|nr:hypothetical protein [Micromonospora sp. PLK6-60]MBY8873588.1 hypothetical protein [Micromonospora sp. PLK6-60]
MNGRTEEALRAAVRDLADEARGAPDIAGRALRRGRSLRRRRRVVAAGAALAATAVLAGPFVWLRPDPPAGPARWAAPPATSTPPPSGPAAPPAASTPSPSGPVAAPPPAGDWARGPLALPGGWVLTGATSTGTPAELGYALDRSAGRYVTSRYEETWAAPRGGVAAVVDYERRGELGLLELRTGQVRWVKVGSFIMTPHWSPDGRRLALTLMDKDDGGFSLGVLTVDTADYRTFPVDGKRYLCTDQCFFTWSRDGAEVALQQTDPDASVSESQPHARRGVQFFSPDDGRPSRFVPVKGDPDGPWSWSPDGRSVIVKGPDGPLLAEVATGRTIGPAPAADAAWVAGDQLLYRDRRANEMLLVDLAGRVLARQALPPALEANPVLAVAPR